MATFIKEESLDTTRFEQQTDYYCGPACCQMFLSLPKFSIKMIQSVAFEEIQRLNTEGDSFFSDPNGVSGFLDKDIPTQLLDRKIEVCAIDTFQDALAQINFTIGALS